MDIEKYVYENIVNTVMDVAGKTKDNFNMRLDLKEFCVRDELHIRTRKDRNSYKPKAKYTLSLEYSRSLCEWLLELVYQMGIIPTLVTKLTLQTQS